MKLLITGVHGFVGTNLVKALAKDNIIYGLDIIDPIKDGVKFTFKWDDLEKEGMVPEVDAIIHLAGKAHDTKNQSAADVYFKVNTGLTQKIFDWYLAHPTAKKFIQFSTVKSAADRVEGDFLTEECIPTPVGSYGESKIAAENYIIEKFAPEALKRPFHNFTDEDAVVDGKKVYIMRPCMIHGLGNKGNLNLLYGVVSKGIPWPLGAFENRRSFTSIGNLQEVIKGIPRGMMNGVAKIGDVLHLPLNTQRMQKLTENYVVSNAKIKAALGMKEMPVRAKDGLRETIKSFAKN